MPWDVIRYQWDKKGPEGPAGPLGQFLYAGTKKVPLFSLGIIGRKHYVKHSMIRCFSLFG